MADVVLSATRSTRHAAARSRRRRGDLWVATTALVAAMLALPLAQSSWHGPEMAAALAVSATALLAGQRWAIAAVAIAEVMLAPTVVSRGLFAGLPLWPDQLAALGALIAIVPGVLASRRAAAALVLVSGRPRTSATCRRFHIALAAIGVMATIVPLVG
jgi:hypothetical protein